MQNHNSSSLVSHLVVLVVSSTSYISTSCPTYLTWLPLSIGLTKHIRASRLQADLTSKRGYQCTFVAVINLDLSHCKDKSKDVVINLYASGFLGKKCLQCLGGSLHGPYN